MCTLGPNWQVNINLIGSEALFEPQMILFTDAYLHHPNSMGSLHVKTKIVNSLLCIKETWKYASVHWLQGKCQLWANCFMCWMPAANLGPLTWETLIRHSLLWAACLTSRPWPIRQKRIGTSRTVQNPAQSNESIRAGKFTIGLLTSGTGL